jgi:hypothetical protein
MVRNSQEIVFSTKDETFCMFCSDGPNSDNDVEVYLEDVCGDVADLVNSKVISAVEAKSESNQPTYTFYTIRTNKGTVTLRWYGTSNGYYSEEALIYQIKTKTPLTT